VGVTSLSLLVVGLVYCVFVSQKKSKFPFLPCFLHPLVQRGFFFFFGWRGYLWALTLAVSGNHSLLQRSLEPGTESTSANLAAKAKVQSGYPIQKAMGRWPGSWVRFYGWSVYRTERAPRGSVGQGQRLAWQMTWG
jgi:hypothetical protein